MQWRIPFIVQMVPGVFFLILMSFQPETPRYLVENVKFEQELGWIVEQQQRIAAAEAHQVTYNRFLGFQLWIQKDV